MRLVKIKKVEEQAFRFLHDKQSATLVKEFLDDIWPNIPFRLRHFSKLHVASMFELTHLSHLLLKRTNVDLNREDELGRTPVYLAA